MDVVRTIENGVNKISLSELLFQYIVQRIREKEFICRCPVIKRNIIAASAEFMIAFPTLPISVQPVPPCNHIFKLPLCSGGILQSCKGFCPQFSFELLTLQFFLVSTILKGMFLGVGFQFFDELFFFCNLPSDLFG